MAGDDTGADPSTDLLGLAEELRLAVGRLVRSVRAEAETPTSAQAETLALLGRAGPLSVAELAARRHVRHQSMRLVAGQLETQGLIRRLPNPADGRSQLLTLTDSGQAELSRGREARAETIATRIETRLTAEERRTLAAAIRLIERLG